MIKTIKAGGNDVPMRLTLSALEKFENKFKDEGFNVFQLDTSRMSLNHFAHLFFFGIEAGYKASGETAPAEFSVEWVKENLDLIELTQSMSTLFDTKGQKKSETE